MLASGVVLIHTWVTASGSVTLFLMVNRWYTGSRSPRVSPHYCFVGGVKFLQGEGSAVIRRKKELPGLQRRHLSVSQPLAV